ncbi:MAG: hypothetical protein ACRBBS_05420 [Thalassovita sp.]
MFRAPIGYKYERVAGHGNVLVRDQLLASIIQEALEGFASGHFEAQAAKRTFVEIAAFQDVQMTASRDKPPLLFRVFADAAFAHRYDMVFAMRQHLSA